MNPSEQIRFDKLYKRHLRALKLQGLSDKTIDVYPRAVRRIAQRYDCCPDRLTTEQLEVHFAELVESHSWSTVKVDRNGLQFFYQHVLKRDWSWINIIKAPKIQSLPDLLTLTEVEQLIGSTRKLRYRVFLLSTCSMGLRLGETLALEVGDIDAQRNQVHIRRGKGHKDRLVPPPDLTYQALGALWCKHHHPRLLFPNAVGTLERIRDATTHMDRGGGRITFGLRGRITSEWVAELTRNTHQACRYIQQVPRVASGRRITNRGSPPGPTLFLGQ